MIKGKTFIVREYGKNIVEPSEIETSAFEFNIKRLSKKSYVL